MRIPFIHRKPEDIASIARRATYAGSAEVAGPRLRQDKTLEDTASARTHQRAPERLRAQLTKKSSAAGFCSESRLAAFCGSVPGGCA